jgi:cytochrome c-type biogenesis protein
MRHRTQTHHIPGIFFTAVTVGVLGVFLLLIFLYTQTLSSVGPDTLFWFGFALMSGLLTALLPCTLPVLFLVAPSLQEKRILRSLGMVLLFTLGITLVLGLYGFLVGMLGQVVFRIFPNQLPIHTAVYFIAGIFAYILALGELGLVSFRMPTYRGMSPSFIRKREGSSKLFSLGLFFGNIGVGCTSPAIPLLLINVAIIGDPLYGALLFLVHAIGRMLPIFFFISPSPFQKNKLDWIIKHKSRFEHLSGWFFLFVAGSMVTIGMFTHEWLYNSKAYQYLSDIFATIPPYFWSNPDQVPELRLFGFSPVWGSWYFICLLIIPLWWMYFKERSRVFGSPIYQLEKIAQQIERCEEEVHGYKMALHTPKGEMGIRIKELHHQIESLITESKILEEGLRFGATKNLQSIDIQVLKEQALSFRRNWYITLSLLSVLLVLLLN